MEKNFRIKKSEEIEKVLKNKHLVGNRNFCIYIKENSETMNFRLGVSVSKKIGNAVTRNKIKRKIRQVFIDLKMEIKKYDIFVVAKSNSKDLDYSKLKYEITGLLKKLKILKMEEK